MKVLLGNNSNLLNGFVEYREDINGFLQNVFPGEADKIVVNKCLCSCVDFDNLEPLLLEIAKRVKIGGSIEITEPYFEYIIKLHERGYDSTKEINSILFSDTIGQCISCFFGPEEIEDALGNFGFKNISCDLDKNTCTYTVYGERING